VGSIGLFLLLFLTPLVVSIVVAVQFGELKSRVEDLRRRLLELEGQGGVRASTPPPIPKPVTPAPTPAPAQPPPLPAQKTAAPAPARSFDWESIVGVKLFAWVGGLAFFLGIVFLVKYSFDNNLITPALRIAGGGIVGIALILVGTVTSARNYRVPAQSLCVTGVLILYADIYAAHSFYNLIPLSAATVFMWLVTGAALFLAAHLAAQSVAWLGVIGGFLTPALLWTNGDNAVALFGYIGVLNCGIAAISALKRWNHLILLAAIGSVITEFAWMANFFGPTRAETARIIFLGIEALFLAICLALHRGERHDHCSAIATAITAFAALTFCSVIILNQRRYSPDFIFPILLFANAGLIALGVTARSTKTKLSELTFILLAALALTAVAEVVWHVRAFGGDPLIILAWYAAIFLVFAATPYVCGVNRIWPWFVSAVAGPIQFWFAYQLIVERIDDTWIGLLPLAFAIPAAVGVVYLVKRQQLSLASADSRLAIQGAAIIVFISLVFAVQLEREWITIAWALEGVGLLLLFRWIPNRRLRAVALIVLCAAFVRLALNPQAIFNYHPRSRVHIFNWYLYAYGIPALCCFAGARLFGEPREKPYERRAPALLYALGAILFFLLLNIEIADYFSIGPTLTFSFHGNFARDMTYTIAWAVFAFVLLVGGVVKNLRPVRLSAIALLSLALAKLFLHDLDSLNQLYRIGALISVAVIAIIASFIYQRFLSPGVKKA
jgi:uncharacterized membrane protein